MNLLSVLSNSLLSDVAVTALAKKTGLSKTQLKKVVAIAIPLLLKAMTKNVSSQSGVQSLLGALTQHTNTRSIAEQIDEADDVDGGKIVGHILGNDTDSAVQALAVETDMDEQQVRSVLSSIAPALLSGLSAATTSTAAKPQVDLSDGLDLSDVLAMFSGMTQQQQPAANTATSLLGALLGGTTQQQPAANPTASLLGSLLGGTTQQHTTVNPTASLLGSLLGGTTQQQAAAPANSLVSALFGGAQQPEKDDSLNGNTLLSALLSAMQ